MTDLDKLARFALHGSKSERIQTFKHILKLEPDASVANWCKRGLTSNDQDGRSEACLGILKRLKELRKDD